MAKHQNARRRLLTPLSGITLTTRAIHSLHYTLSNSYKMIRSPRLCSHWPPPHSKCHRRSSTPTSLAEAVTQLSFLEFLQRCNLLIALPQPPQLPVPISLLDAAVQTLPHCCLSHVSTQTCTRPVSSLSLDAAVQTPLHSVVAHDVSTQLPLTEVFIGCILSNDPLDRQPLSPARRNNGSASLPQLLDITALCSTSSASHASDGHEHTTVPHALLQPPPGLEEFACQHASHGIPVKAAPVRPRLCSSNLRYAPAVTCQYHLCGNTSCALSYEPAREVPVPPLREPTTLSDWSIP